MPGYWNRGSAPRLGWAVRTGVSATAVLIVNLGTSGKGLVSAGGVEPGGTPSTNSVDRRRPGTCRAGPPIPANSGTSVTPGLRTYRYSTPSGPDGGPDPRRFACPFDADRRWDRA